MSIKQAAQAILAKMAEEAGPDDYDGFELLTLIKLVGQLQEPQTPRRAPDLPEPGEVFWQMVYGEPRLCAVHSCCLWVTLNLSPGKTGRYAEGERIEIKEWIPYTPPQFTEQGL